jgi:23S rRNA pseudouridine2605 synthase
VLDQQVLDLARTSQTCDAKKGPKVKINTKVAEVVTDSGEKTKSGTKRPKVKDEIRLNKYIANSGA